MRHALQLFPKRGVDMRMIMAVNICPDRRIPVDVFAAAAIPQNRAVPFHQNERLVFRGAPFAHVRERMPDELFVGVNQLVGVPVTHERRVRD